MSTDGAAVNPEGTSADVPRLSPEEQLDQLVSYIEAHYDKPDFTPPWKGGEGDPAPADNYCAKLPDRITHAAMLVLGSAGDHAMPGVVYTREVETREVPELDAVQFTRAAKDQDDRETGENVTQGPAAGDGVWVISLHSGGWWRGSGAALEMQWRPEVAAVAQLSGATVIDLDYPLAPEHTVDEMDAAVARAINYAREHGATTVAVWGYSSGAALAALSAARADALVLTFPDFAALSGLPGEIRYGRSIPEREKFPQTFLQIATRDEVAERPALADTAASGEPSGAVSRVQVREYVSQHRVSTPEVARERIEDVADFLRGLS